MGQERRPTMRDVAAAADVSLKTVSRVVNREAHVSSAVEARVTEAISALGYQVDDRARRLRRTETSTGTVGVVVVDVSNDFFAFLLRGVEEVARANDSLVLSASTDGDPDREDALVASLASRRVDGLLVVTSRAATGPLRAELDRGTPVVVVDLQPDVDDVDVVRSDHRAGGRLAGEHLLAHGHRRLGFLGDEPGVTSADERLAGFEDALRAAGVELPPGLVVRRRALAQEWHDLAAELLDAPSPPTAVFSAQNFATLGLVRVLHERGLQHDVAVVGYDDLALAALVSPGITVVPQEPFELGRRAATRLFDRIAGLDAPATHDLLAPRLVERGSGELPPPG